MCEQEWEIDLLAGAEEILRGNPHMGKEDWKRRLMELYPTEIVDTYGTDEVVVDGALDRLWLKIHSKRTK